MIIKMHHCFMIYFTFSFMNEKDEYKLLIPADIERLLQACRLRTRMLSPLVI